ncbi:MAG: hypothetical protein NTV33_01965 [Coprothermobacterota bacterium]|nr:hypothetical protein [Coprothermobacterota bacterium]
MKQPAATRQPAAACLYYSPIIHMEADLGSLGRELDARGQASFGKDFWQRHQRTVENFWRSVQTFLQKLPAEGLIVFQDGMVVGGEVGERIVREVAKNGSLNFQIVEELLGRGAILVQTEDLALVKAERDRLLRITQAAGTGAKLRAYLAYRLGKRRLLRQRDAFISRRILEELKPGGRGLLLLGAEHRVIPTLPPTVQAVALKDPKVMRAYHTLLLHPRRDPRELERLAGLLAAPVEE